MKKKALSLILALAMVSSLALCGFAAGLENFAKTNTYEDGKFTDVKTSDWYAESVKTAYELGLVKGSSEETFNPKGNITVAETIVLASRLHNIYNGGKVEFVQGSPWYQVYVDYAMEKKIITAAYKDYNAKISRANFAFILVNALPAEALEAINDVADGSLPDVADDYKANAIYTLYRAGVLTGNDEFGTFNPDSTITRAEVAAIITRMADKAQRKTILLKKKASVSVEIYRSALAYTDMIFQQSYGMSLAEHLNDQISYGMTGADVLKGQAFSLIQEFEAARLFAIENGLELSDSEKKEIEAAKKQQYDAVGGKNVFIENLNANGVSEAFYDYIIEGQFYYAKVSELFGEGEKYAVDTNGISTILSENYIRVKHILIQADSSSADYKEKETLAKNILQKINRGEDFEKLLAEYGEDPGMLTNPDGYLIDSNGKTPDGSQMIAEFTTASVALKVGGVSGVVPTAYGFHIIKRYPMDKTFVSSYIAGNMEAFKENAITNILAEYAEKVVISNRAELEKIDVASVFGK